MNISRRTFSRRLLLTLSLLAMVGIVAANLGSLAKVDAQMAQQPGESHGFPTQSKSLDSVPGEILVRFRSGSAIAKSKERSAVSIEENDGQIPVHIESLSQGPEIVDGLRLARVEPEHTTRAIAALQARSDVLYAEPNYIWRKEQSAHLPNDPNFNSQYALQKISAPQAWATSTGSSSVVVAVIDEGIDIGHPDLQGNIWTNPGEVLGNGLDDDGDGFPDDVHGWDFSTCSQSALSNAVCGSPNVFAGGPGSTIDSHGTHVAGIIGARGDNGIGVTAID